MLTNANKAHCQVPNCHNGAIRGHPSHRAASPPCGAHLARGALTSIQWHFRTKRKKKLPENNYRYNGQQGLVVTHFVAASFALLLSGAGHAASDPYSANVRSDQTAEAVTTESEELVVTNLLASCPRRGIRSTLVSGEQMLQAANPKVGATPGCACCQSSLSTSG